MVNTTSSRSSAERFGRWLGRSWRGYVRRERSVVGWMASRGMPGAIAAALPWVVRLTALGLLLYFTFWLALLLVFLVLVARGVADEYDSADLRMSEAEWRFGHAGYGLYTSDGYRIDQHNPDDPDNT